MSIIQGEIWSMARSSILNLTLISATCSCCWPGRQSCLK